MPAPQESLFFDDQLKKGPTKPPEAPSWWCQPAMGKMSCVVAF